jgi:hypothetical protein
MKKPLIFMLLIAVTLMFGAVAHATVQNMDGWFSIDVPDGWTVNKTGDMFISIASPNGTEVVTFEYASAEGMDPHQFALSMSGGNPVVITDRDDYEFVCSDTTARAFMIESIGVVMKAQNGFDNIYEILATFTR